MSEACRAAKNDRLSTDLERFFGAKVFLGLRVKVNPDWRDNERTLDELGVPKRTAKPKRKR